MEDKSYKPSSMKPMVLFIICTLFFVLLSNFWTIQIEVMLIVAVLAELFAQVGIHYYKVTLIDHSMRCYDMWGTFYLVDMESIEEIQPANFLGLRYLKLISTKVNHTLWLPLFLSNYKGFVGEVLKRTTARNPLHLYLEEHPAH